MWRVQFNKRDTGHNQVQKQLLPSLLRRGWQAMQAASEFGNSEYSETNIPGLPGRSLHSRLPDSISPGLYLLPRAI